MIAVRFKGGFGDQLFQYAAGRALAARHGVGLRFDPSWYDRAEPRQAVERSFDLSHFAVQGQVATPSDLRPFFPDGNRRGLNRAFGPLLRPLFGRSFWRFEGMGFAPEFARLGPRVLLEGYFQDPRYFATVQDELRGEFHLRRAPPPEILARAVELSAQPSVCIQVRRTDFVHDPRTAAIHGTCDLEYFQRAWAMVSRLVPAAQGLVFADDPGWAQEAFRGWAGISVIGPEWNGPAFMHKFFLMRSCRHFVIANSTWGWWTAWLGSFPGKTVIMPTRWFADPVLNEAATGLRLPGWLQC